MKLTNESVVNILNMLDYYSNKKLPQKISYAITRNLMLIGKNYEYYINSLHKLFSDYDNYIVKDENNNILRNDDGIPIVDNQVKKEFDAEISNLLNVEIEIELYCIPENIFDYDDNNDRYDSLSAADIINLQNILCIQERRGEIEISNK